MSCIITIPNRVVIPDFHKIGTKAKRNNAVATPHSAVPKEPTILAIQCEVAHYHGLSVLDLLAADRSRQVALARQSAMWLARRMTRKSLPTIARLFAHRHHTTVLHAVRVTDQKRIQNAALATDLDHLKRVIERQTK